MGIYNSSYTPSVSPALVLDTVLMNLNPIALHISSINPIHSTLNNNLMDVNISL